MEKKSEILHAAFKVFAQKGYDASLLEIANAVGLKKQSLYSHFKSKEEIFYLIAEAEVSSYFGSLGEQLKNIANLNTEESLRCIFFSIAEYFKDVEKLKFWRWIMLIDNDEVLFKCRNLIRENELKNIKLLSEIFAKGYENGEIDCSVKEGAMSLYMTIIQGVLDGILFYSELMDIEVYLKKVWDTYWWGIKKK